MANRCGTIARNLWGYRTLMFKPGTWRAMAGPTTCPPFEAGPSIGPPWRARGWCCPTPHFILLPAGLCRCCAQASVCSRRRQLPVLSWMQTVSLSRH